MDDEKWQLGVEVLFADPCIISIILNSISLKETFWVTWQFWEKISLVKTGLYEL